MRAAEVQGFWSLISERRKTGFQSEFSRNFSRSSESQGKMSGGQDRANEDGSIGMSGVVGVELQVKILKKESRPNFLRGCEPHRHVNPTSTDSEQEGSQSP